MLLAFAVSGDISIDQIIGNLLFAANLPPSTLIPPGAHFWSLCIEVQFYLTIALLVAIGGRRSLLLIPTICITITLACIYSQQPMSIASWFRIDEILRAAVLALIFAGWMSERLAHLILFPSTI